MKKNFFTISLLLSLPFVLFSQDDVTPQQPSELERLIIDIQSKVDIEKRFDFSRANSKEKRH